MCSGSCQSCSLMAGVQLITHINRWQLGSWVKGAPRQIQTKSYVPDALIRHLLKKHWLKLHASKIFPILTA